MLARKSSLDISVLPGYQDSEIYSDGPSEDILLKFFTETPSNQLESRIQEILTNNPTWPERVHLSPQRHHLLDWFDFRQDARLLEIGAGCGAMTGLFANHVALVDALEPSTRRANIIAQRHRNRENIRVLVGDIQALGEDYGTYDYVIAIGVLEYAGMMYVADKQGANSLLEPTRAFLQKTRNLLTIGGVFILAIENQIGLKYLAGYAEDHYGQSLVGIEDYLEDKGVRTFARPELQQLLEGAQLTVERWYYPFPDYKLPMSVYSDTLLPGSIEHPSIMYPTTDYAYPSEHYFSESRFGRMLHRNYLSGIFANSFLVICTAL